MRGPSLKRIDFRERIYRRRHFVPNMVTLGNMFCGFIAIVYASSGRFEKASIAIFMAILLDGLDGRVARRLKATSRFGLELDSFADMVSFGIAPAMLIYHWAFVPLADEFGVFVTFVYALCAASRLARFNISSENLTSFNGLPSPGAAALMAALVFCVPETVRSTVLVGVSVVVSLSLGALMVSKFEYYSIKQLNVVHLRRSFQVGIGGLIALIWWKPKIGILALSFVYAYSGIVISVFRSVSGRIQQKRARPKQLAG